MDSIFSARGTAEAVPIWFVTSANYPDVQRSIGAEASAFAEAAGFEPKAGRYLLLPGKGGAGRALGGVLFGVEDADNVKDSAKDPFLAGRLPQNLPDGTYRFNPAQWTNENAISPGAPLAVWAGLRVQFD